jgi:serine protease Do
VGDRLLAANEMTLAGPLDWQGALLDLRAGDRLTLEIEGRRAVEIEAGAYPTLTAERVRVLEDIELITVTPPVRSERGLRSEEGAMIVDITPDMAQRIGLRPGDVIVGINRTPVRSAEEFARIVQAMAGRSGQFVLTYERNGGYNVRNLYWR